MRGSGHTFELARARQKGVMDVEECRLNSLSCGRLEASQSKKPGRPFLLLYLNGVVQEAGTSASRPRPSHLNDSISRIVKSFAPVWRRKKTKSDPRSSLGRLNGYRFLTLRLLILTLEPDQFLNNGINRVEPDCDCASFDPASILLAPKFYFERLPARFSSLARRANS